MRIKVISCEWHNFYKTSPEDTFEVVGTTNYGDWLVIVPDLSDEGGSVQRVYAEDGLREYAYS